MRHDKKPSTPGGSHKMEVKQGFEDIYNMKHPRPGYMK
jgi:hypothetical protein